MNLKIARLVLNAKCKIVVFTLSIHVSDFFCGKLNVVHLVACTCMLESNEKICKVQKTEKAYLFKHRYVKVFLVPGRQAYL